MRVLTRRFHVYVAGASEGDAKRLAISESTVTLLCWDGMSCFIFPIQWYRYKILKLVENHRSKAMQSQI